MIQAFDYGVMKAVQSVCGPILDRLALAVTFLGEETFVLLLLIAVYWCFDKRLGEYMLFSLFCAMSLNGLLKDLIRRPRPFMNPDFAGFRYVKVEGALVDTAGLRRSGSFPSGHSQTAGSVYGAMARKRSPVRKLLAGLVILMVMVSRVYLGVHYPTDTIAGAVLGLLTALLCGALFRRFYGKKVLLFGLAVILSCAGLLVRAGPDTVKVIGLGAGSALGMMLEDARVKFRTDGKPAAKILRLLIGFALLMGLRLGLKLVFPDRLWLHAVRYGLVGFTGTFLWPLLFSAAGI